MAARTGEDYLAGLRDSREVWLGSSRVDVATHPTFAGSLAGMSGYFDWQHVNAEDCLETDPTSGELMNASLMIPQSVADLRRRRRAFEGYARYSKGALGRTPDYVNATLAGFVGCPDIFQRLGAQRHADNLNAFYRRVVEKDLSLTHAIVHPSIDRGAGDLEGINANLALKVVRRTRDSIVVRGAKVLATLGPFADELFIYPGAPQSFETDPAHILAFSIPMSAKGLVTVCRDHYGQREASPDTPFSSWFDEQDAVMIFDDVEIPLENVFVDGHVELYNTLMYDSWNANILQQTCSRAAVKLEFFYDICVQIARATNCEWRQDVKSLLGEIWSFGAMTRSALEAAEVGAKDRGSGTFICDDAPLRAVRAHMPGWMARAGEAVKILGAHNLLATPSLEAFDHPRIGPLLHEFLPGAGGVSAPERARLFRIAWDFVGSALGERTALYERFYLGSAPRLFGVDHALAQAKRAEAAPRPEVSHEASPSTSSAIDAAA